MLFHMYPAPPKTQSTKSIEWGLFVHSMSGMGFCARNKGGSAVEFEREFAGSEEGEMGKDEDGERALVHRSGKIILSSAASGGEN
ncbi:hypothetical protein H4I95_07447 [Botrytis cinerea]